MQILQNQREGPLLGFVEIILKGGPLLFFAPSSLAWVQRAQAGLRPNPHVSWTVRPLALRHNNPTVCSLACRWQLRLALRADRESFVIDNPRGRQHKA